MPTNPAFAPTPAAPRTDSSVAAGGVRVYYGWAMVVVAAAAMVATLPGRTFGLGMVTERLLKDPSLGLTRTSYAVVNLWATLIGAAFCFGCGRLVDRWGVRAALVAVLAAFGGVVVGMSCVRSFVLLCVAITLTRGFGQSALSVVSLSIVGRWFRRRLSWATAMYAALVAVGFAVAFKGAAAFAEADWRSVWCGLGAIVVALAPLARVAARNSPEELGLELDGRRGPAEPDEAAERHWTPGEALRTPAFWCFGLTTSLFGLIASGISLFNESILADRGFPKTAYYDSVAWGLLFGLAGKGLAGWAASRWSIARVASVALVLLAASLAWLVHVRTYADLYAYVAASSVAGSVITVVFFMVWPRLYGRVHLGRIQGVAQMLTVVASAVGPLALGGCRDLFGSYVPALWLLTAVTGSTALLAWITPLPYRTAHADSATAAETSSDNSPETAS